VATLKMIVDSLAKSSFPHDSFYPGQESLYLKTLEAFSSGKKVVVLEGPTGLGKSAIALGVSNYFKDKTVITTTTKTLQAQYLSLGVPLHEIKGASNYTCYARSSQCSTVRLSKGNYCTNCVYKKAIDTARVTEKPVISNNSVLWKNFADDSPFYTVISDEVHLLEDCLKGLLTFQLSLEDMKLIGLEPIESMDSFFDFKNQWSETIKDLSEQFEKAGIRPRRTSKKKTKTTKLHGLLEPSFLLLLSSLDDAIVEIADNIAKTPWVISTDERFFSIRPTFGGFLTKKIFPFANRLLLMSATIGNAESLLSDLNVEHDHDYFVGTSPFPKENRPILYFPIGRLSYKNKEELFPDFVKVIDRILNMIPHKRGIIHVSSYNDQKLLFDLSENKHRLITHRPKQNEQALDKLKEIPNGVLVTPSMYEGVDLKGDLGNFSIITKMPYPSLGDPQVKSRFDLRPPRYDGKNWFQWTTVNKFCQAYGRIYRSPDCIGPTYVLDGCFGDLLKHSRNHFSNYVLEAIVKDPKNWKPQGQIKELFTCQ